MVPSPLKARPQTLPTCEERRPSPARLDVPDRDGGVEVGTGQGCPSVRNALQVPDGLALPGRMCRIVEATPHRDQL